MESKHRSLDSLKFVKFLCKDVVFYIGLTDEEIGKRIRDLIANMASIGESEYPENRAAIEEAQFYLARRYEKIAEWKRKKSGNKDAEKKPEEPGLFNAKPAAKAPANWQGMARHELEKLMLAAGISSEKFFRWHEYSSGNDWLDAHGNPMGPDSGLPRVQNVQFTLSEPVLQASFFSTTAAYYFLCFVACWFFKRPCPIPKCSQSCLR